MGAEMSTEVLVAIVATVVTVGCLFVMALFGGASGHPRPRIVHPNVTPLDARRKLLEKARRELAFQAKFGRMPDGPDRAA
jgi:hypothetical protein